MKCLNTRKCNNTKFVIWCTSANVEVYCDKCFYHKQGKDKHNYLRAILENKVKAYYDETSDEQLTDRRIRNILRTPITKGDKVDNTNSAVATAKELAIEKNLHTETIRSRLDKFKVPYILQYEYEGAHRRMKHYIIESEEYKSMVTHYTQRIGIMVEHHIKNTMRYGWRPIAINGVSFESLEANLDNADYVNDEDTTKLIEQEAG